MEHIWVQMWRQSMDRLLEDERELIKLFEMVLNLKYVDHKIHGTPEETEI